MTKKELIRFLEPFTDDIRIVGFNEEYEYKDNGLTEIYLEYRTAKCSIPDLGLIYKDGYIKIT